LDEYKCERCGIEFVVLDEHLNNWRINNASGDHRDGGQVIAVCPNCGKEEPYGWAGHAGPQGVEGTPGCPDGCLAVYEDEILSLPDRTG
jgi:hypothetical protein